MFDICWASFSRGSGWMWAPGEDHISCCDLPPPSLPWMAFGNNHPSAISLFCHFIPFPQSASPFYVCLFWLVHRLQQTWQQKTSILKPGLPTAIEKVHLKRRNFLCKKNGTRWELWSFSAAPIRWKSWGFHSFFGGASAELKRTLSRLRGERMEVTYLQSVINWREF